MSVAPILLSLMLVESPFMPDTPQPVANGSTPAQAMCTAELRQAAAKSELRARRSKEVANLPESYGKTFRTLDAYLVHLQCHAAPVDGAWWQQIAPGVYRHVTTATNAKPETATRAQLMKRFGFRH